MREIKFRAWTGIVMEHRVVAGQLGSFYVEGLDPKDSACMSPFNTIYGPQTPIMQFTGLLDKNGKEIYEGDILSFAVFDYNGNDTQYKGCIVFAEAGWQLWKSPQSEFYGADGAFQLGWVHPQDEEIEVIGNIHEHPEHLK